MIYLSLPNEFNSTTNKDLNIKATLIATKIVNNEQVNYNENEFLGNFILFAAMSFLDANLKKYFRCHYYYDDAIQTVSINVWKAIKKYNPAKCTFWSFCSYYFKRNLLQYSIDETVKSRRDLEVAYNAVLHKEYATDIEDDSTNPDLNAKNIFYSYYDEFKHLKLYRE